MTSVKVMWMSAIACAAIAISGPEAAAQTSYYGYGSPQTPAPSGQANYTCQPGQAGCQPEKYGCYVNICPCPCSTANACQVIASQIPAIHPVPGCQEACTIYSEAPPQTPRDVVIWRNCYVPIKIQTQETRVVPVNILVKWREIHYLCDEYGNPVAPSGQGGPSGQGAPSSQGAMKTPAQGTGEMLMRPTETTAIQAPAAPTTTVTAPAPAPAPAVAQVAGPAKNWVWLANEGVYGYGFQRADGYWIIDEGSRRKSLPTTAAELNPAPNVTVTASTK